MTHDRDKKYIQNFRCKTEGRLGIDAIIVLKWILKKQEMWVWTKFIWLRIGTSGGCLW
jgi:hypothetical protein